MVTWSHGLLTQPDAAPPSHHQANGLCHFLSPNKTEVSTAIKKTLKSGRRRKKGGGMVQFLWNKAKTSSRRRRAPLAISGRLQVWTYTSQSCPYIHQSVYATHGWMGGRTEGKLPSEEQSCMLLHRRPAAASNCRTMRFSWTPSNNQPPPAPTLSRRPQ